MSDDLAPRDTIAGKARIAVIVPAYGVAHLLAEALDSLLRQTLSDWECLVIDDGSPVDVSGVVAPYLGDSRFRFLATENRGVSAARNTAIRATKAPYLALLDGDDMLRPTYLERMVATLDSDHEIRLATCNARVFGAVAKERLAVTARQGNGDGIRGGLVDVLDRSFNVYVGSSFRRDDFETVGGFDEQMTHAEDFDFWVRLMLLGGYAHYDAEVLGDYRVRANSASGNSEKIVRGVIHCYEKALDVVKGSPEEPLLHQLIDANRRELAFEHAIEKVIAGDTQAGIAELRTFRERVQGPLWKASLIAWSILPALAIPMLRFRREAHRRGNQRPSFPFSAPRRAA